MAAAGQTAIRAAYACEISMDRKISSTPLEARGVRCARPAGPITATLRSALSVVLQ
jgi:hypothetical protein